VAQLGRISGPLLVNNLERQGINLSFRNNLDTTQLLFLDVNNGYIGVNKSVPSWQLDVDGTTRTTDLIALDQANIADFSIFDNNINISIGDINISSSEEIITHALETPEFTINDNFISTNNINTNIIFDPSSTLEVLSNLNVAGNLTATGDITLDGTITFGDSIAQDTVSFNTDVQSDIIPNINNTYKLGSPQKRWDTLYTNLVNGKAINTNEILVGGINFNQPVGNIFYVSTNGDNTAIGDNPQAPLATIEEALSRVDGSTQGPVKIHVYAGTYVENTPLVVPSQTSIIGENIRSVVISGNNSNNDVFLLDGESTVSNLTIKDFRYNSTNNTGYAFRYNPNGIISTRSPYIQNVSVITQGSITSADDPRGFDAGDAGKGAWIDGSELNSASIDASMLFHSCTFITPGVDAVTMTNGVRVEWLNSFTYFADRGLYAVNGVTGRTTQDGSTINYGAEIRSIGSANVYGNYGAVADGSDTLMYLIQHNIAYIGSGKFVDNDRSRSIQANEIVELNNGQIHYVTTDHTGNFRVGDNFLIDFETGSTTIDATGVTQGDITTINIDDGVNRTVIDNRKIQTGNIRFIDNNIESLTNIIEFSPTTDVNFNNNVFVQQDTDIIGNLNFAGSLNLIGNEATDTVKLNVNITQDFNPDDDATYTLGSLDKNWQNAWLSEITLDSIRIFDNVIETTDSNSNLELRANGTGNVVVPSNNVLIENNLTVNGITNFSATNTQNFTNVGDVTNTGNLTIQGSVFFNNLKIDQSVTFDDITINDNFISTVSSNSNLELRTAGTGSVVFEENTIVNGNVDVVDITASNANITLDVESDNIELSGIDITNGVISTNSSNSDLELSSTGNVVVSSNIVMSQNVNVSGIASLKDTDIAGTVNITGNVNQIGNYSISGDVLASNILINDNFITTTESNSDLELRASGTGRVVVENATSISNNLDITSTTNLETTNINGLVTHVGNRSQTGTINLQGDFNTNHIEILQNSNILTTTQLDSDLIFQAAGTGTVDFKNSTTVTNDVSVLSLSNLKNVSINGEVTSTGNINQTGNFSLAGSFNNQNISIFTNIIETTQSNSDLDFRASGTGKVILKDSVDITNNLSVLGNSVFANADVDSISHTGDRIINGSINVNGDYYSSNIEINDNFITTTLSNSDLELRASGTGIVDLQTSVNVINDAFITNDSNLENLNINGELTITGVRQSIGNFDLAGELFVDDIKIEDNFITTTSLNTNLSLEAGSLNSIILNDNVQLQNDLTVAVGLTQTNNLNINGLLDHTGDYNQTGNFNLAGELTVADVYIEDNFITVLQNNQSLTLRATGDISISTNDVILDQDLTVLGTTTLANTIVNGNITHIGSRAQTGNFDLAGELFVDDINVEDNFISTTQADTDLVLSAETNSEISIPLNDVRITNNLSVSGVSNLKNTNITGTLTQTGSLSVSGETQSEFNTNNLTTNTLSVGTSAQLEEILIVDNSITTTNTNENLELRAAGTGKVVFPQDALINNNVNVRNLTVSDDIFIDKDFQLNEIIIPPDIIEIDDNFITTSRSNESLELRANGTGNVLLENSSTLDQNLNVNLETTLKDTSIVGSVTFSSNVHIGNYNQTGDLNVSSINTTQKIQTGNVIIDDNFITTATGDLELSAAGTGNVSLQEKVFINNNLSAGTLNDVDSIIVDNNIDFEILELSTDIQMLDNVITTTNSNSNLEIRSVGNVFLHNIEIQDNIIKTVGDFTFTADNVDVNTTGSLLLPKGTDAERTFRSGSIRFNTQNNLFEGYIGSTYSNIGGGIYSSDRQTSVTIDPKSNTIRFINQGDINPVDSTSLTMRIDESGVQTLAVRIDDVSIDNNTIQTTVSNSNLEIVTGSGSVVNVESLSVQDNTLSNPSLGNISLGGTGRQWVIFEGDAAVKFPSGTTLQRPANPIVGTTRHNTDLDELETWTGTEWKNSGGDFENVTEAEMEEEAFVQTLIYG